jgi:hypothetical protein
MKNKITFAELMIAGFALPMAAWLMGSPIASS